MGRHYDEFKKYGAEVLVILGEPPEPAAAYAKSLKTPFLVLADPDRAVYHSFDLEKAFLLVQRTASVIIDRDGVIQYIKRATNSMQWHAETHELLETAQSLQTGTRDP